MRSALALFDDPGPVGLIANVAVVWIVLGASILLLTRLGSDFGVELPDGPRDAPWTPPGQAIGAVWSLLYTLMAASLWALNRVPPPLRASLKLAVAALIVFCIVWPFYAFDTRSRWPGLLGNLGILALALFAVLRLWPHSRIAALMLAPVALWIVVATATILDGARRYGW